MKKIILFISLLLICLVWGQTTVVSSGAVWKYLGDSSSEDQINPFAGTNIIAAEVHQRSTSSDVSVDPEMIGDTEQPVITRKAPYLIYKGNSNEMQVLWQLTISYTSYIEWGLDTFYTTGNAQTFEYGSDHQHKYTIQNLIPGSKYYYRVIVNAEVHTGSFRSAPSTETDIIKFIAYGDTRSYPSDHDQVAAGIVDTYNSDADFQTFILSAGDLVSNGNNEADWDEQFFDPSYLNIQEMFATMPYQSCMGNHEGTGVLFTKYFPYPFESGRYWAFDYGPAHFVVVDQYTDYGSGSAQLSWIENELASTTKKWKFIILHEPGWSAGHHENNTTVQDYIQPLCETYGVSIVFGGHNHYYARAEVNGVQHVTAGGGGAPLYAPDPDYPNIVASEMAYHFCKIEINGNLLNFEAQTPAGVVFDSFTIEISDPVLPVTLSTFTAAYLEGNAELQWTTQSESNNMGWNIYRSNSSDFNEALQLNYELIAGAGTTSELTDYSYDDETDFLSSTTYWYWLESVTGDGETTQYESISLITPNDIEDPQTPDIPREFGLYQNYPNPFNPETEISFALKESGECELNIYNIKGELVKDLFKGEVEKNRIYNFNWSGLDNSGKEVNSGVYLYRLKTPSYKRFEKMLMIK